MRTDIVASAESLLSFLRLRGWRLGVAESCTGGLLGAALTSIDGASSVFEGGFLVYSNRSKVDSLGVSESLLREHGAVSAEVAEAMAFGILQRMEQCDLGISITGVAGEGTENKPQGLVYIGLATQAGVISHCCNFSGVGEAVGEGSGEGFRDEIRHLSVLSALDFGILV